MDINDFRINLTFTIEETNMIFGFLGKLPHDEVSGLIGELKRQIEPQLIPPENFDDFSNDTDHPV
jgi:hypothetical protein